MAKVKTPISAHSAAILLAFVLCCLWLDGCGAHRQTRIKNILTRNPTEVASRRLARAVFDANRKILQAPTHRLAVRYNPAHCHCPDWEVYMYGGWHRAALLPTPDKDARRMTHARLAPTNAPTPGASGWQYPSFRWSARAVGPQGETPRGGASGAPMP